MRNLVYLSLLLGNPLLAAPTFDATVKPIFAAKCASCHNEKVTLGKLSVESERTLLKGGETGPAILPGDAAKSLLIDKVVTRQMPPGKDKLTDVEIDRIREWINTGLPKVQEVAAEVSEHEVRGIL